ncbi:MAG: Wzy polymerase domain-containing protein [Chania sp.]
MSKKKTAWLFGLLIFYFIFAMHISWPNRGGSGFYLPWNMIGLMVIALLVVGAMAIARPPLAGSRFFNRLAMGSVVLLLPLLWTRAPYLAEALPRLIGLLLGVAAYLALLQYPLTRQWRQRLLIILLAATAIEALFATVQYLWVMPNNLLPYGIFQQVNVLASFMACGLALALCLFCGQVDRSLQALIVLMLFMAPFLLLILFSRVGLLAFILLTPLQLWLLYRVSRPRFTLAVLLMLSGLLAAWLAIALKGAPREITTFSTISYRLIGWQEAWQMLWEKPWLGWGYGSFQYHFLHHIHLTHPDLQLSFNLSHPHNEILLWGVEGGLLSLAGIVLICFGLWQLLRRNKVLLLRPLPLLAALPILLHMMVEYPLSLSAAHGVWLLVLLRTGDVRQRYRQAIGPQQVARVTTVGIAVLTLLYMANGLHSSMIITAVEKRGLRPFAAMQQVMTPTPWQTRYDFDLYLYQLLQYPQSKDLAVLRGYQQWGELEIRVRPEANIYFNLTLVSRLLQQQRANALVLEAQRLFPEDKRFKEE